MGEAPHPYTAGRSPSTTAVLPVWFRHGCSCNGIERTIEIPAIRDKVPQDREPWRVKSRSRDVPAKSMWRLCWRFVVAPVVLSERNGFANVSTWPSALSQRCFALSGRLAAAFVSFDRDFALQ